MDPICGNKEIKMKEYYSEEDSDIENNNKQIMSSTPTESGPEKPYYQLKET